MNDDKKKAQQEDSEKKDDSRVNKNSDKSQLKQSNGKPLKLGDDTSSDPKDRA